MGITVKPRSAGALEMYSRGSAIFTAALGALVLAGWLFDIGLLESLVPSGVPMKPNSAAMFILIGISLWCYQEGRTPTVRRIGHLLAGGVMVLGLLTLLEYLLGWETGLDRILISAPTATAGTASLGRMSILSALGFTMLGTALLLDNQGPGKQRPSEALALATVVAGMIGFLDVVLEPGVSYTGMSLVSALTFVVCATGVLAARPHQGVAAAIATNSLAGFVARRLVPAALGVPLFVGWAAWHGAALGFYGQWFAIALSVLATVVMLVVLTMWLVAYLEQAETSLRETRARMSGIVEAAMDAIITVDEHQRIVLFNPAAEKVFGYSRSELIGHPLERLIPDRFRLEHREFIRSFGATGATNRQMEALGEVTGLHADGRELSIEASLSQVVVAGQKFFTVILRDTSEFKRATSEQERFFNISLDMLCILSTSGYFKRVNPAFERVLGFAPSELLGKNAFDYLHPDDHADSARAMAKLAEGEAVTDYVNRFRCSDGTYRSIRWMTAPDGDLFYAAGRNITGRLQAEKELRESEETFAAAFRSSALAMIITTLDGTFVEANPAFCEVTGYSRDEIIGHTAIELGVISESDREKLIASIGGTGGSTNHVEIKFKVRDGTLRDVIYSVTKITLHGVEHRLSTGLDITERKRTDRELAESQRFLQSTLDALASHIAVLGEDGTILAVNKAWREFAERNAGDTVSCGIGANYLNVCTSANGDCANEAGRVAHGIREVIAGRTDEFCLEYPCHSPTEQRWFNVCVTRFVGEGPVRVVVAHENITQRKLVEEKVRNSEANLAVAQEMSHLGSWDWELSNLDDLNSCPLQWSDEVFRILGYQPGQIAVTYDNFIRAVHPDDRGAVAEVLGKALYTSNAYNLESRIVRPDGAVRFAHVRGNIELNAAGRPQRMIGTIQDITERKRAEAAVREYSEFQRTLLENFPNGSVNVFDRDLRYVLAAGRGLEAIGLTADQLVGKTVEQAYPPESAALARAFYLRVLNGETVEFELAFNERTYSITAAPLRDSLGSITNILAVAQDISERRAAERAVRESGERLRLVTENARVGLAMVDPDHRYIYTNAAYSQMLDLPTSELVGRRVAEVLAPLYEEQIRPRLDRTMSGERVAYELHRPAADGIRYYAVRYEPITVDGRVSHVVVVITDTTERHKAEVSLQQSNELLRAVTEGTTDAIFAKDAAGRYLMLNAAGARLLSRSAEEILGKTDAELFPTQTAQTFTESDDLIRASGVAQTHEQTAIIEGNSLTFLSTKGPLRGANGEVVGIVGIARDISERKQIEDAVRESRARFAGIINAAMDAIVTIDENQLITLFNPAAEHMFGTTSIDAIGKSIERLIPHRHRARHAEHIRTFGETGMTSRKMGNMGAISGIRADGEEFPIEASISQIEIAGQKLFTVILRDITERRKAEIERDRFFTMSVDILGIFGLDGSFKRMNPAFHEALGYSEDELESLPFMDLVHRDDQAATQEAVGSLAAGNPIINFENRYRAKDGSYRWLEWKANAVPAEGLVYAAGRDITERKEAEEAVRQSAELLRAVTDGTTDTIFAKDTLGRYVMMNQAGARLMGRPVEELLGKTDVELMPTTAAQTFIASDAKILTTGAVQTEEQTAHIQGKTRIYLTTKGPLRGPNGDIVGIVGNARDITEFKQVEATVRESAARVTGIVNAAMDAIITIDQSQRIILFNPAAEKMFGYESSTVLGGSIEVLIPARFRAGHAEHIRVFSETGMTSRKMGNMGAISGVRANGDEFPIEASISQIEISGQKLFTVILRDISERREAELALQRAKDELEIRVEERTAELKTANTSLSVEIAERQMAMDVLRHTAQAHRSTQQMLQLVMDHIPQAIFWKDMNSVYLGCNYRLARDAGYESPDELKGKDDRMMPWAQFAEAYIADDRQVMESDAPKLGFEEPMLTADGSMNWLRTNKVPLHDVDDNVVGVLCSYEDITERKAAEAALLVAKQEAEAANLAKSEFLSRMSHELRTPLNSILGFGQILEKLELDPLAKESIGYILKGGRHLLDLINEVLDIARVEAGRIELSLEPIALDEVIPETCALMKSLAGEYSIHVADNKSSFQERFVLADRQRLKQVLINLLANAIKYNREGGRVDVVCEEKDDGWIAIDVRDTGHGISAEGLLRLFTPFERLSAANTTIEGTGLGLALSQRLTAAMGGTLSARSTLGEGSIFTITLPQTILPSPVPEAINDERTNALTGRDVKAGGNSYTILCIEDNLFNQRLLEVIFHDRPEITLLAAMQGSVGLDLARRNEPDLILLDLNLPDMQGREVLTRLQNSGITRDIPVVVISADATPTQIERLLAAGAKAYLTKPLDVDQFLSTVHQYLTAASPTIEPPSFEEGAN